MAAHQERHQVLCALCVPGVEAGLLLLKMWREHMAHHMWGKVLLLLLLHLLLRLLLRLQLSLLHLLLTQSDLLSLQLRLRRRPMLGIVADIDAAAEGPEAACAHVEQLLLGGTAKLDGATGGNRAELAGELSLVVRTRDRAAPDGRVVVDGEGRPSSTEVIETLMRRRVGMDAAMEAAAQLRSEELRGVVRWPTAEVGETWREPLRRPGE